MKNEMKGRPVSVNERLSFLKQGKEIQCKIDKTQRLDVGEEGLKKGMITVIPQDLICWVNGLKRGE